MHFQFDSNQKHQLDAILASVGVLRGQSDLQVSDVEERGGLPLAFHATANPLNIDDNELLRSCNEIQRINGVEEQSELRRIEIDGEIISSAPNFSIEMETGTGKTYVYLRTIYELHKTFGLLKFVVVVPSVPIKEGVIKAFEITRQHFESLYDGETCSLIVYDSAKPEILRSFAIANTIQVLLITIDSFAKDTSVSAEERGQRRRGNVINQTRESGEKPIHHIQSTRPVVILDEPQNMETPLRKAAIARLNPLIVYRYSATPRNSYNTLYRLDPVRAYQLGLVKQVGVDSVISADDPNEAFVELLGFSASSRSISAKLKIWKNGRTGAQKSTISARVGIDLFQKSSNRESYRNNFVVSALDSELGSVEFANGLRVTLATPLGTATEEIQKLQLEATIRRHLEKEQKLSAHGIKVLSVIFIDRVSNYREYSDSGMSGLGPLALAFEEAFERLSKLSEFPYAANMKASEVHGGYFAADKRTISPYSIAENKSKAQAEDAVFKLIMRDKERLLDRAQPLRFIFSHSALREGWDNPNVFQICTLGSATSESKKRQELGRGLRLCVDGDGKRVYDSSINVLTVIANESYEDFAKALQGEFEDAGLRFSKELVRNEKARVNVVLRKGFETNAVFRELWERIKHKTTYRVKYDTVELITECIKAVEKIEKIEPPRFIIERANIALNTGGVTAKETGRRSILTSSKYVIPDLIARIQEKTSLSRSTVSRILLGSDRLTDALVNPQKFIDSVTYAINASKLELIIRGIEYRKLDEQSYEMRRFESDALMELFKDNAYEVADSKKTIFSHIKIDGNSSIERTFAEACDSNDDVLFYIKLPGWFEIETPVGSYNPDWAIAYRNQDVIYFVAETKGQHPGSGVDVDLLRPLEAYKIECGKRHFAELDGVIFKPVSSLAELV